MHKSSAGGPGQFRFEWYTDGSYNYTGYEMDALQIHCSFVPSTPNNSLQLEPNYPYHGYLLGEGDVIYVKVRQPAGHAMGLLLWPRDEGTDFDVLASASHFFPSYSQSDWSSTEGGKAVDLAFIPAHPTERTIYIAIGSFHGRGQFRFQANVHAKRWDDGITVGVDFNPSDHNKQAIRRLIQKTAVAFYQATEGRLLLDDWQILWAAPNQGHIRLLANLWAHTGAHYTPSSPVNPETTCWNAPYVFDHITVAGRHWCLAPPPGVTDPTTGQCDLSEALIEEGAVLTLVHELGHMFFGLRDEYGPARVNVPNSGHT
ncbi:MAG: hypothetical protein JRH20_27420 [Deltaproteobacteria bacterium]|nr:hypothetical protein [Deltaproteobacteria bacterium]